MTITIPAWLLWTLGSIGGLLLIAVLFSIGVSAWLGWLFAKTWRPPNW